MPSASIGSFEVGATPYHFEVTFKDRGDGIRFSYAFVDHPVIEDPDARARLLAEVTREPGGAWPYGGREVAMHVALHTGLFGGGDHSLRTPTEREGDDRVYAIIDGLETFQDGGKTSSLS
jgi:hypothetical protein